MDPFIPDEPEPEHRITTHHDGHGLTETIIVTADDPVGPGGAHHHYRFEVPDPLLGTCMVGHIQFQYGPRSESGSITGVVELAVLAVVRDRLEAFQSGPYACEENARALDAVMEAMTFMKLRADNRAKRGVLGTYQK